MKKWDVLNKSKIQSFEDILQVLLQNRGFTTKEEIDTFLNPQFDYLSIENVGLDKKQLTKTIKRINKAIEKKEQVIIYGDYDVDGITASAILWETLHTLGAKVMPYLPNRVEEGYGLSIKGIENIIKNGVQTRTHPSPLLKREGTTNKIKLIITVDNGIVANEAVKFANENGIDVIITDHHVPAGGPETLPEAYAIVHTTMLCGAGVAYMLAREINKDSSARSQNDNTINDNLLELAALGTIADLVPLKGGNRIIVKYGLPKLGRTKRPGLLALFAEAGCDAASIGVYEVGHTIAPRLNATGRMSNAIDSLRLLCTKDKNRAEELAGLLGTTNKERQNVMTAATEHAIKSIKYKVSSSESESQKLRKLLIAVHEDYPEGVIGLVAGRVVEEFYRPAIVISKGEKLSKGSVRSISGFNIIEFLRNSSDFFVNVGGHPMAAGFTIATDRIEEMQEALENLAEAIDEGILIRTLRIDCELPLSTVNKKLYESLKPLGPFGMANPEPTFATRGVRIDDMKVLGREGKHLRLTVSQTGAILEAIAFGMGERAKDLKTGDTIDIAYTVDMNNWNGRSKLQLKVKDIQESV